jgi:hypothetical protein
MLPIVAIAVVAVIVICLCVVVVVRTRRADEGERFRHVANLTSAWSRERPAAPASDASATESVDGR